MNINLSPIFINEIVENLKITIQQARNAAVEHSEECSEECSKNHFFEKLQQVVLYGDGGTFWVDKMWTLGNHLIKKDFVFLIPPRDFEIGSTYWETLESIIINQLNLYINNRLRILDFQLPEDFETYIKNDVDDRIIGVYAEFYQYITHNISDTLVVALLENPNVDDDTKSGLRKYAN